MGQRGPHARPIKRPSPVPKPHVTYQCCCWECRKTFEARYVYAAYCSGACRKRAHRQRQRLKAASTTW